MYFTNKIYKIHSFISFWFMTHCHRADCAEVWPNPVHNFVTAGVDCFMPDEPLLESGAVLVCQESGLSVKVKTHF